MDALPLTLIAEMVESHNRLSLPKFAQEIARQGDIPDFQRLKEGFESELENGSLQTQEAATAFLFLADKALWYGFLNRDQESLFRRIEIFKHRIQVFRAIAEIEFPFKAWGEYLNLMTTGFLRIIRNENIETFESKLNELDWSEFEAEFIPKISLLIGLVYAAEEEEEQLGKARIWLQKALMESSEEAKLGIFFHLVDLYQKMGDHGQAEKISQLLAQMKKTGEGVENAAVRKLYDIGLFELEAVKLASSFTHFDNQEVQLEHCQLQLKNLETSFAQRDDLPGFSRARIESIIAELYSQLYNFTGDDFEKASFSKYAKQHIEHAVHLAEKYNHEHLFHRYRLKQADLAVRTDIGLTEKEMKELVQYHKKRLDYPRYCQALNIYSDLLERNDAGSKSYDLMQDAFKWGQKRLETGGFYILTKTVALATRIFEQESQKPGVSWMVDILEPFFQRVQDIMDEIEGNVEVIGHHMIHAFRKVFHEFEPISHFHIKVYYRYQWYNAKAVRLGAILAKDQLSIELANKFLTQLEEESNALSFIKADWDEFKKVPNSVRNKTLNKCINISKGDLPLAAEHLDFSYRNLRSYITFKEVNRLGFFLDMQQTANRQLEQGIRYMFYDLYKRGTIFEVVFDMPKFLVDYANSGFFSQDLERELTIKGTTAKKYIKIMMEIGLIRQDKTTGRKHYYRLMRENVMKRLGKDKATLISSQPTDLIQ